MAVEPWNREIPTLKKLFEVFRVENVLTVKQWPDFYLYKIVSRKKFAYEKMIREWIEQVNRAR